MVRRQMGLLDDAIRDHLELKRRRGADPGEVAREQSEAFPTAPAGRPLSLEGYPPSAVVTPEAIAASASRRTDRVVPGLGAPGESGLPDGAHVDQDTAEFDMALVLSESPEALADEFPPARKLIVESSSGSAASKLQDDALEWDFPGASASDVAFPQADQSSAGNSDGSSSDGD